MAQQLSGNDLQGWDGWIYLGSGTRISATSFSVPGDYTSIIPPGAKLKVTDTTTKYFYFLTPVTFSGGNTTFTITGGSDYSLVGNPTGIYYSLMQTPQGFPQFFNYSPSWTGFSTAPTAACRFNIIGRMITVTISATVTGTSNSTGLSFTAPVAAETTVWHNFLSDCADNGAATSAYCTTTASSTTVTVGKGSGNINNWTATGNKFINGTFTYAF